MQVAHTYEACFRETVPSTKIALFISDPKEHGPDYGEIRLDMSNSTRASAWNQAVADLLASKAHLVTCNNPGSDIMEIDWSALFTERINRIISD
ncbi:hypothetical protein F5051DRAFT_315645, partial [Lentinula edodes]